MNVYQYLPQLLSGVLTTLELMLCALLIGALLAILLTVCSYLKFWPLNVLVNGYKFFIRGTPLLVQIFLIYYGSSQWGFLHESVLWELFKQPFACAVIALAINTSAYSAELFSGAIASIPKTEIDAARALGLSIWDRLCKIIAPRALRIVLPAYSNEVIIILKSTALASTITLLDFMGVINKLIAQTYATIFLLALAGSVYLVLNLLIIMSFKFVEKKLKIAEV